MMAFHGLSDHVILRTAPCEYCTADTPPPGCKQIWTLCGGHMQVAHAWLRYKSLAVLQFNNINQKRACLLARASVSGQALPGWCRAFCVACIEQQHSILEEQILLLYAGVQEGNKQENILAWPLLARPSLTFATSLENIFGGAASSSGAQVQTPSMLLANLFCSCAFGHACHTIVIK